MPVETLLELKRQVLKANQGLVRHGLVELTWGNASGILRNLERIVIKPSGVQFDELSPEKLVVTDLQGNRIEGELNPSSDLATHLELYRHFPDIGGIVHFHSPYACMFAQAGEPIPCLGTTHADHFFGPVPITPFLTPQEVLEGYEINTGLGIVRTFRRLNPMSVPGVLTAGHGPFTWGSSPLNALDNAVALEMVAKTAFGTLQLNRHPEFPQYIQDKHFQRKHGPGAYYGQPDPREKKPGEEQ